MRQPLSTLATLWALVAVIAAPAIGRAEPGSATRLVYVVPTIARGCPSEGALVDAIAARLGRDPFVAYAERTLRVVIIPGDQYGGRIELYDAAGRPIGAREIGPSPTCGALREPLALAIAVALDPLELPEPPPPPPPPPTATPEPLGWSPYFSAAALVAVGTLPAATPGARLEGGIGGERWSVGLEARFEAPATKEVEGGVVSAFILAGGLSGCFRYDRLEGCLVGVAGALQGEGSGLVGAQSVSSAYATIGARARYSVPVNEVLAVFLVADFAGVTTQIELIDSRTGDAYWRTPVVHGILAFEARITPAR